MATAVIDLELSSRLRVSGNLTGYTNAYVLLRYRGKPVGVITVPVTDGVIHWEHYQEKILQKGGDLLREAMAEEWLGLAEAPVGHACRATIAICTRNRTDDLRRCLEALSHLPDDGQEVLVVDNCPSNNDTQELVALYPFVRYVREPRPGLNIARNTAIREATGEIVAFTDDDAVPDTGWLRAIVKPFDHPLVACVTGATFPLELETEAQERFETFSPFNKGFETKVYKGSELTHLSAGHIGAGANMALRRSLLKEVGPFDPALDAGTATRSGGDHEYFIRMLLRGYHIVYEPSAISWHRHRRTDRETVEAIRGYGTGVYAYWTRLFLVEKEYSVIKLPLSWMLQNQVPDMWRALIRRDWKKLQLLMAEWRGCLSGPGAYLEERKRKKEVLHEN